MNKDLQYLIPRRLREHMIKLGFEKELERFEWAAKVAGLCGSMSKEQLEVIVEYAQSRLK